MKMSLSALNEYLFESLDRLTNEDLSDEELEKEVKRNDAIQKTAKTIIENGALALQTRKYLDEYGAGSKVELPFVEEKE